MHLFITKLEGFTEVKLVIKGIPGRRHRISKAIEESGNTLENQLHSFNVLYTITEVKMYLSFHGSFSALFIFFFILTVTKLNYPMINFL